MQLLHTMLRVGDMQRSIDFYTKVVGMDLLRTTERPDQGYTLAFVAFRGGNENGEAELELTYNHGVSEYDLGSAYGHIALGVESVAETCERIRAAGRQHHARTGAGEGRHHRDCVRGGAGRVQGGADRGGYARNLNASPSPAGSARGAGPRLTLGPLAPARRWARLGPPPEGEHPMSQAAAPVARVSAPSAHPFSPPDIVLPTEPEDERVWVPLKEGVWLRPLMYNTVQGGWCEVVKVTGGGFVSRHRHPAPVHGLVLKGAFRYLEHDWIADQGTYIYEPPGEVHTLVVDDDCPEMHCFFAISGSVNYVDEEGRDVRAEDVFHRLDRAQQHYEEVGLGADYVKNFVR